MANPTPEKIQLAKDLAEKLAGQWVEYAVDEWQPDGGVGFFGTASGYYAPVLRAGRIVGHVPTSGEVVLAGSDSPYAYSEPPRLAVLTQPRTSEKFQVANAFDVITRPLYPKKQLIAKFPHACRRCQKPALELFRTIDCSNWRCDLYYLR